MNEIDIPWKLVVEGDQIYSAKTKKWYEVYGAVSILNSSQVKIFARGIPKAFYREGSDITKVRRGGTGKAVDVFQIIFSGQTTRDVPESEKL